MFRFALVLTLALAAGSVSVAQTPDPKPLAARVESLEIRVRYLESLLMPAPMPTPVVSAVQYTAVAEDAPACVNGRCSTSSRTTSTFQQSTGSGPFRRLFGR